MVLFKPPSIIWRLFTKCQQSASPKESAMTVNTSVSDPDEAPCLAGPEPSAFANKNP